MKNKLQKHILFVTGTRADYGKLKPLIKVVDGSFYFKCSIFVSGMHLLRDFGDTYHEVLKDGYEDVYVAHEIKQTDNMSENLGNTISVMSTYLKCNRPDMIIVHGDRIDALAGAITGALNNIMVGHVEGGEVSGTIDESIRHAVSKFAHAHFTTTEAAAKRIVQLGENRDDIYIIGSPDIDIMLHSDLPSLKEVKNRYGIHFENYAICMYHPVTTEYNVLPYHVKCLIDALLESKRSYVMVYPNNDQGAEIILNEYRKLENLRQFVLFPSLRFEYFLTLLKNSEFVIGNSSSGIYEAGVYGIPVIDIGTRQSGRYDIKKQRNIIHVEPEKKQILSAIKNIENVDVLRNSPFGDGHSAEHFFNILMSDVFWQKTLQKRFIDIKETI